MGRPNTQPAGTSADELVFLANICSDWSPVHSSGTDVSEPKSENFQYHHVM